MKNILQNIALQNDLKLTEASALAGGDINEVFLLKFEERELVVKINSAEDFPGMFDAEAKGLQLLRDSKSFIVPEVFRVGEIGNYSYLMMEYLGHGQKSLDFWENFGQNLAKLHKVTNTNFGLDHDNYIGSLPQSNKISTSASQFYIEQRLQPQFKKAVDNGFNFNELDRFYKNIYQEIPEEKPALIHGDLWSGNYLTTCNGNPALIDPAIAFAPREMDIAMMKLFGGFSEDVYEIYNSVFPLEIGWEDRVSIWQLYYLLVHLNLFGSNYLGSVKAILSKFR